MEINARIYAVADDKALLEEVHRILRAKTFSVYFSCGTLEPCAVLPLAKTWYGFTERAEPTDGPEGWTDCLRECARILKKRGAVIAEFYNVSFPDEEPEYAWTTAGGSAGYGPRPGLIGYERALGNRDILTAYDELLSGRSEADRERECRRRERKEAARREKGDFEVSPDGVLIRYRGKDTDVVIPAGVREIGPSAFVDVKGVERMILKGEEYDAPAMETLTVPDSVEAIGDYAFAYCLNLKSAEIADSVRKIGWRAFEGCESLRKVRLPAGLEEIGEYTFFLCESLKTVTIPDSVKKIGAGAFDGTGLKKACIPAGVQEIGKDAFPERTEILSGKG